MQRNRRVSMRKITRMRPAEASDISAIVEYYKIPLEWWFGADSAPAVRPPRLHGSRVEHQPGNLPPLALSRPLCFSGLSSMSSKQIGRFNRTWRRLTKQKWHKTGACPFFQTSSCWRNSRPSRWTLIRWITACDPFWRSEPVPHKSLDTLKRSLRRE